MLFGRDPKKKAVIERAMTSIEKMLRDMQDEGKDLAQVKLKKFQKTHFTSCTCPRCLEAKRKKDPRIRGLLEDGFKVFVGEGSGDDS